MEKNRGAKLANPEHVEILKQGVEVWNEWRKENPDIEPDLSNSTFVGSDLPHFEDPVANPFLDFDVDFGYKSQFNFVGVDLSHAELIYSKWHYLNLSESNFFGSNLYESDFFKCTLQDAILEESEISGATVRHCFLYGTDFSLCICDQNLFTDVDLSCAKGLDKIIHEGPSSIGIDTLFLSKGEIPVSFLRGCGVPEDFIKLIPSLTGQPFEFYKCFISHSSLDMDFCKRLHADLQNEGVRVWFFPEDARTGRGVWDEIDKSIKIYDKLMVVCSENSLQSGPVLREIERALQREDREGKHILFPVRIDDYIFDEWEHPRKADVIAKVVGDFSNWKDHDSYQKAFDRLMRDLKASEEE